MKFILVCLLVSFSVSNKCIALVHGMGGNCEGHKGRLENLQNRFKIKAICINNHEKSDSLYTKMEDQSHEAYENLKDSGCKTVYLIAISQGAVIANYIIANQHPDDFEVKGLTTFGGVNRGIHSVKNLLMDFGMSTGSLFSRFFDFSFSSYKRGNEGDSFRSEAKFLRKNINEIPRKNKTAKNTKEHFLNLDKIILIGYSNENMFNPYETAYFLWANENGERLSFDDDRFFNKDKLGVLEQFKNGKLEVFQVKGSHGKLDKTALRIACEKMISPINERNFHRRTSREDIFNAYVERVDERVNIKAIEYESNFLQLDDQKIKSIFSSQSLPKFSRTNSPSEHYQSQETHEHRKQSNKMKRIDMHANLK